MTELITLKIDGHDVEIHDGVSILQAAAQTGALTSNVGCMGQGVCGACRCLIRREGERTLTTALACETKAENGFQVSFIDYLQPSHPQTYDISDLTDSWMIADKVAEIFPEAAHCRHCSGCDRACPKHLDVQKGVALAAAGDIAAAAEVFDQCVMCNLCSLNCPEHIRPNHLGLLARRAVAAQTLRPSDLIRRLTEISRGEMTVDPTVTPDQA